MPEFRDMFVHSAGEIDLAIQLLASYLVQKFGGPKVSIVS